MSRISEIAKEMKTWWSDEGSDIEVQDALDEIIRLDEAEQTEPKPCEWCKFYDGENCFSQEPCKVMLYFKTESQTESSTNAEKVQLTDEPRIDNCIGCSRCEGRFDCYDRDMPHAVHCNNYGKITDDHRRKGVSDGHIPE